MPASMNCVTTFVHQGLALRIEDQGGEGEPVLFQHGLCGDANQTREAFPVHADFRRITLECRGHGQSEAGHPDQLSIATFTQDLAACIESLGARPVVVGGISMGAAISLRLAVKRPDLVRGLILVRPAWITASAPANMRPNAQVGALLIAHPQEKAHAIFMRSDTARHLAQVAPDNLKSLEGFFQREPREVTAELLSQISIDGPGVEDCELKRIQVPTLVLGHDHDFIHPLAYAQALANLIPGATLKTITAKAISKEGYIADLHQAITQFLEELPECSKQSHTPKNGQPTGPRTGSIASQPIVS
jgi:pimeloyl-ACP methyl ester carboxylesterase